MCCFAKLLLLGLVAHSGAFVTRAKQRGAPVRELMPWYKTGDEIHTALHELAETCRGADAELTTELRGSNLALDVFKVRRSNANPKTKAMLVYGEHARELVSPESALNFAQNLCGVGTHSAHADSVLNDVEFVLVPNANPIARKMVEKGEYCKRTNENGVDLNRNWGDDHRDESLAGSGDETDPGPRGFSESETELLKELVDQIRPDIYLSIHSGAYLLGEPFGYTKEKEPKQETDMDEVLQKISTKYCNGMCPYGGLYKMIDYANGGCDIDYVYEKVGTPYAFTWEIYAGENYRGEYEEKAESMRAEREGHSFLQRSRGKSKMKDPEKDENAQECVDQFLPKTQADLESVVMKWSDAYLTLAEEVVKRSRPRAD